MKTSSEKKGAKNWGRRGHLPWTQGEWPAGRSVFQHTWVLAIPRISRNYLHLSISESDLHLLGAATDEWLRLWSSPSRPDEHTYKGKRHSKQKHINGVPQTENLYFENSETKTTQQWKIFRLNIKSVKKLNKHKSINPTRFLNLSAANLNLVL